MKGPCCLCFSAERISFLVRWGERVGPAGRVRVTSDAVCWLDVVADDEACVVEKRKERKERRERERENKAIARPGFVSCVVVAHKIASLARSQSKAPPQSN